MDKRIAIVTGGSSGIGEKACEQLVDAGAVVISLDRDLPLTDKPWQTVIGDVSSAEDWGGLVRGVIDGYGRVDVLINNAGIGSTTSVLDCSVDEWDRVMAVNARGVFLGTKSVLPPMLSQGGGFIVNIASVLGLIGAPDRAAYGASKGAVIALTKQVAIQFADQGIRCNAVAPGTVDSPWVARLVAGGDDPNGLRSRLIARQPMGRLGEPKEIAAAAVFLASPAASFMTGTVLTIDGGITAGIR